MLRMSTDNFFFGRPKKKTGGTAAGVPRSLQDTPSSGAPRETTVSNGFLFFFFALIFLSFHQVFFFSHSYCVLMQKEKKASRRWPDLLAR